MAKEFHSGSRNKTMKKDKLFNENYVIDAATNLYMIEVGLAQYAEIFSEWDPAPFKRREIDPDLETYLERSSDEIPWKYSIELCFIISAENYDEQMEGESRKGLENSFAFKLYLFKKERKKVNARMLWFIIVGFVFLGVAATFAEKVADVIWLSTLVEGLSISGWVLLWEAVSLFFFTNRELYHRYRTYKRLQNALVVFREA
jgi:hypothetical protein